MARRTLDEIMQAATAILGDRTDDEALGLLEDLRDSYSDSGESEWRSKYEELDGKWRKRYRDTFLGKIEQEYQVEEEQTVLTGEDEAVVYTYDGLFEVT